jgi:carbamoyl-phosphate synthase small subunit
VTEALLVLEDGTAYEGTGFGAGGESFGEIVFNTGMSGYQEVLTDPSYARQIVVMTSPHIGNYGVNAEDPESGDVQVAGFVVREAARRPSSWRSEQTLAGYLAAAGVIGMEGLDTRALTLHIREAGAMRAAMSTEDLDPRSLVAKVRDRPEMLGSELARTVSTDAPYDAGDLAGRPVPWRGRTFRAAAFDWGIKRNSLRLLARSGCEVTVYPALTRADAVLAEGFDGVFLSNGPGDPAATDYAVETTRSLLGKVPVFGICLGHQMLGRAIGGSTYKLKFGHRGANQPVLDTESGRVEITSHNHGFAVDPGSFIDTGSKVVRETGPAAVPPVHSASHQRLHERRSTGAPLRSRGSHHLGPVSPPQSSPRSSIEVTTDFGRAVLTHWNLNDGTLEGLRLVDVPALSVQYHPEAAPGPHDSAYLFDRFSELMAGS